MNEDGYIKLNGHDVAEDARTCIRVLHAENVRLRAEFDLQVSIEQNRRKALREEQHAVIDAYINSGQHQIDFEEVLEPYYDKIVIRAGWWFWREIVNKRLSYTRLVSDRKEVMAKLQSKNPLWQYMDRECWYTNPSSIISYVLRNYRFSEHKERAREAWDSGYSDPYDVYGLDRFTNLVGEVYLTISDYNRLLRASEQAAVLSNRDDSPR